MGTITSADYWRAARATIKTADKAYDRYDKTWDYWLGVRDAHALAPLDAAWLLDRAAADMLAARLDARELRTITRELMEAAA